MRNVPGPVIGGRRRQCVSCGRCLWNTLMGFIAMTMLVQSAFPDETIEPTRGLCPTQFERQVISLINQHRVDSGQTVLNVDGRLVESAHAHCVDLYENCYILINDGCDGTPWNETIFMYGYPGGPVGRLMAGCGTSCTPASVVDLMFSDSTYRAIMLNRLWSNIGAGYVGPFLSVDFGAGAVPAEEPPCAYCCVGRRGDIDGEGDFNTPTLADLSKLIDHLFISLAPLNCWEEGNVDESQPEGPGSVTLSDLSVLIDNLFISLTPTPPCP